VRELLNEIERRLRNLEKDSHPPIDWLMLIRDLEDRIEAIEQKLDKYGI
tara:strand:- start:216 stop:362 length:147 start_codon:yes stop_codon:yes gene_type:complete